MKAILLYDFQVDKATATVHVTCEFAASLDLVWRCWTEAELLDQWWAPKPYFTKTQYIDLKVGGRWFYSMNGPEGDVHYCAADYKNVNPTTEIGWLDAFTDASGTINEDFPRSDWSIAFEASADCTTARIRIKHQSLDDLEKIIAMGFREGFNLALHNLDQYLAAREAERELYPAPTEARVSTYLNFPGTTEEAFMFYQSVFKTAFTVGGIQRFGDLPPQAGQPPMAESLKRMVLHVELPILGGHVLMGTDAPKEMGFTVLSGNQQFIQLEPATRAEAQRLYTELSAGGEIEMDLQEQFWGALYASFTDKYGIRWMINCRAKA